MLLVWGLTDVRSRGRVDAARPGVHRTDFTVYTEAGAAFFDGRDPYAVTNPRGWGYLYPPLFAILVSPLHALHPQLQVVTWFFLNLLLVWACYRECLRLVRLAAPAVDESAPLVPRWLAIATIATVALPTLNCLQRGQVGVVKIWLLLLGLRLLLESRSWRKAFAAGGVFAAAIALKITPPCRSGCWRPIKSSPPCDFGPGACCPGAIGTRGAGWPPSAPVESVWASPQDWWLACLSCRPP